jgi:hypothetical protein
MNDLKTTILGAIGAGVAAIGIFTTNGGNLADWKLWVVPCLIAIFGYFTNKPTIKK